MRSFHQRDWPWLVAAIVLAGLATPPVQLLLPPFVYLAPAAILIARGQSDAYRIRRHFLQGLAFGFGTNLVVLSWLPIALWRLQPGMLWIAEISASVAQADPRASARVALVKHKRVTQAPTRKVFVIVRFLAFRARPTPGGSYGLCTDLSRRSLPDHKNALQRERWPRVFFS